MAATADGRSEVAAGRLRALVVGVLIVVGIVLVVDLANRTCAQPTDVSGTTRLPAWLIALKNRDELAYPAHALLGTLLNDAGCPPVVAGLQWVKAGAHARNEHDIEAAGAGLAVARERASQPETFDATLCQFMAGGFANTRQEAVVRRAALDCTPP
jgi:hypothetical protein